MSFGLLLDVTGLSWVWKSRYSGSNLALLKGGPIQVYPKIGEEAGALAEAHPTFQALVGLLPTMKVLRDHHV